MSIQAYHSMIGLTMSSVISNGDELIFISTNGKKFKFYHSQDCCENVNIEDIIGDLSDLVGSPLWEAEEISEAGPLPTEIGTWTFYRFSSGKGTVTVRWLGTSNGYYSEGVSFSETN